MNGRGLRRLAIALTVPWALSWGAVYYVNANAARADTSQWNDAWKCLYQKDCDPLESVTTTMLPNGDPASPAQTISNQETYLARAEQLTRRAIGWKTKALWFGSAARSGCPPHC
jgi:hypothetical protein